MQIVHYSGKTQRKCPPALLLFCSVLRHIHSLPAAVEFNRSLTLNIMFVFFFHDVFPLSNLLSCFCSTSFRAFSSSPLLSDVFFFVFFYQFRIPKTDSSDCIIQPKVDSLSSIKCVFSKHIYTLYLK